ncbi:MAG: 2-amino-4-hydroxy-6-hydroxymethyldihydropteridine diphosphokinase [Fibrobacterota bacterium]
MTRVALCIGCNLGRREISLRSMQRSVSSLLSQPVRMSDIMDTEPVGVDEPQPWYLNRIISGYFNGTAAQLLQKCFEIESDLGRKRFKSKGSRTADVDILLFGGLVIRSSSLTVPHPEIVNRRFCLEGLKQIEADWEIPGVSRTVEELYGEMCSVVRDQTVRFSPITM